MKTFTDSNTIIEQEQRYAGAEFTRRIELLRQYSGTITARVSSTQIKVSGDVTSLLAVNNVFIIPRYSFTEEHTITAISFSSGETTITCSGSSFAASGLVGLEIAKRFIVSGGNTERLIEISPIRFDVEGDLLSQFRAQEVELNFDNSTGYFSNSSSTGLLDNTDVFWVRIYFGWKRSTDRVLYFGGVVDRDLIKDDRFSKMFMITAHGHLKELERYPAWLISEPFGDFLKLSGIELIEVTANSLTNAGIKKLEWNFVTGGLQGVEILSISKQATFGTVPLKFKAPNFFKFAWGDWTEIAENTATSDLTGADGSILKIRTTNYDVRDREIFLQIAPDFTAKIEKSGSLELVYDGGSAVPIVSDFDSLIVDAGSTTYTDRTNDNDREGITYTVLQASDAAVYIFSDQPFYGIEIFLDSSTLVGQIDLAFSNGFNSWQALTFTDNTSDLTIDGTITWTVTNASGWRPLSFNPFGNENDVYQKFGIRIDLSAYTSGNAILKNIRRYFRAFSNDGTALAFKIDLHNLPTESIEEDLIIREISDIWTPCTWYRNITIQSLVQKILSETNYIGSAYTLENLQITNGSAVISIIGQAPVPFYKKRAKALLWDSSNDILYLGIGNEFWKVTETGEFTLIDSLDAINENADGYGIINLSIRALVLDDTTIHGMAWWDDYESFQLNRGDVESASFYVWFLESDGNSFTEILQASGAQQTSSPQYINPCDRIMRKGRQYVVMPAGDLLDVIGQKMSSSYEAGENLIIPFPQILRNFYADDSPNQTGQYLRDVEGLMSGSVSTAQLFYFSELLSAFGANNGPFFRVLTNYFMMDDDALGTNDGWINFKWLLGNKGMSSYEVGDGWMAIQTQRTNASPSPADTHHRLVSISTDQTLTEIHDLSDSLKQPLCSFILSGSLFFAYIHWDDSDTDLSKCVFGHVVIASGVYTENWDFSVDNAEVSQSISGRDEYQTVLEMIYSANDDAIHGCLLDRGNFEYHWFCYDYGDDKMYSTQTGTNFTFDKHRQFKDFVYYNNKVYAICVDKRYQRDGAFLVEASFSAGTITLNRIDTIDATDWDHLTLIVGESALWGVTGKGLLWKYSTDFYPRIGYAQLGNRNLREVLTDAVEVCNRILISRADRKFRIQKRDTYDGTKTLEDRLHIVKTHPIERSVHLYDRVEVTWSDPVSGQNGVEAYGIDGWERRVLRVENPFVQNRHLAAVLAKQFQTYFNSEKKELTLETRTLLQLEEYDRFKVLIKSALSDIDRATYWRITNLEFDPMNLQTKIKGLS